MKIHRYAPLVVGALAAGVIGLAPTAAVAAPPAAVTDSAAGASASIKDYRKGYRIGFKVGWKMAEGDCGPPGWGGPAPHTDYEIGYDNGLHDGYDAGREEFCR